MRLIHRFGYFFGGFSLGIIILAFFLSGKRTSCDYFPDARVLKDIRTKQVVYSENALENISLHNIDTSQVSMVLQNGDVDFSRSKTEHEPCNLYLVTGEPTEEYFELLIENCDSVATVREIRVK